MADYKKKTDANLGKIIKVVDVQREKQINVATIHPVNDTAQQQIITSGSVDSYYDQNRSTDNFIFLLIRKCTSLDL